MARARRGRTPMIARARGRGAPRRAPSTRRSWPPKASRCSRSPRSRPSRQASARWRVAQAGRRGLQGAVEETFDDRRASSTRRRRPQPPARRGGGRRSAAPRPSAAERAARDRAGAPFKAPQPPRDRLHPHPHDRPPHSSRTSSRAAVLVQASHPETSSASTACPSATASAQATRPSSTSSGRSRTGPAPAAGADQRLHRASGARLALGRARPGEPSVTDEDLAGDAIARARTWLLRTASAFTALQLRGVEFEDGTQLGRQSSRAWSSSPDRSRHRAAAAA